MCFLDISVRDTIRVSVNPHDNFFLFNTHKFTLEPAPTLVKIVRRYFYAFTCEPLKILHSNERPVNTGRTYLERIRHLDGVRYIKYRTHESAYPLAVFQIDASFPVYHEPQYPTAEFAHKLNLYEFGLVAIEHSRDFLPNSSLNLLSVHNI